MAQLLLQQLEEAAQQPWYPPVYYYYCQRSCTKEHNTECRSVELVLVLKGLILFPMDAAGSLGKGHIGTSQPVLEVVACCQRHCDGGTSQLECLTTSCGRMRG
jgi:hypothetical protein